MYLNIMLKVILLEIFTIKENSAKPPAANSQSSKKINNTDKTV